MLLKGVENGFHLNLSLECIFLHLTLLVQFSSGECSGCWVCADVPSESVAGWARWVVAASSSEVSIPTRVVCSSGYPVPSKRVVWSTFASAGKPTVDNHTSTTNVMVIIGAICRVNWVNAVNLFIGHKQDPSAFYGIHNVATKRYAVDVDMNSLVSKTGLFISTSTTYRFAQRFAEI